MKTLTISRERPALKFHAWLARTPWQRLRGLIARKPLQAHEGLLLVRCNSVHTFGMRASIDLAFLDRDRRVIKCVSNLRPFRFAGALRARYTLELPAGTLARTALAPGQVLQWQEE